MRTIRILIISALWHISTALANLLTGYILQVIFIFDIANMNILDDNSGTAALLW